MDILKQTEMKITIETKTSKEVELPKYFKNDGYSLFMLTNQNTYVKVYNTDMTPELGLIPYIKTEPMLVLKYENLTGIQPISEVEFKNAFLRVSLAIEETLNN